MRAVISALEKAESVLLVNCVDLLINDFHSQTLNSDRQSCNPSCFLGISCNQDYIFIIIIYRANPNFDKPNLTKFFIPKL